MNWKQTKTGQTTAWLNGQLLLHLGRKEKCYLTEKGFGGLIQTINCPLILPRLMNILHFKLKPKEKKSAGLGPQFLFSRKACTIITPLGIESRKKSV